MKTKSKKDIFCAICCTLARLIPGKTYVSITSSYKPYFNTLNKDGIKFDNGLHAKNIHKLENLNSLTIHVFKLAEKELYLKNFRLIYKSKKENFVSKERTVDLLLQRNHYSPLKRLYIFIGAKDETDLCRESLTAFSTEDVFKTSKHMHKKRCIMILPRKDSFAIWDFDRKLPFYLFGLLTSNVWSR